MNTKFWTFFLLGVQVMLIIATLIIIQTARLPDTDHTYHIVLESGDVLDVVALKCERILEQSNSVKCVYVYKIEKVYKNVVKFGQIIEDR